MPRFGRLYSGGLRDDGTTAPTGQQDGYASVAYVDSDGRMYFFVNDTAYYVVGVAAAVAAPETGNPIGLLLSLTYS